MTSIHYTDDNRDAISTALVRALEHHEAVVVAEFFHSGNLNAIRLSKYLTTKWARHTLRYVAVRTAEHTVTVIPIDDDGDLRNLEGEPHIDARRALASIIARATLTESTL